MTIGFVAVVPVSIVDAIFGAGVGAGGDANGSATTFGAGGDASPSGGRGADATSATAGVRTIASGALNEGAGMGGFDCAGTGACGGEGGAADVGEGRVAAGVGGTFLVSATGSVV